MLTIDGASLKRFIINGANKLAENKDKVDAMNVFPVPDGDTGTNMSMTITSAAKAIENMNTNNISDIAKAVSDGALRGARGNSGVILSQILRGWYKAMEGKESIDADELAIAFAKASEMAYKAVMKPKEGTMLTIIRSMGERAIENSYQNDDVIEMLKSILEFANEMLQKTPDMLPQLKEAGVVDSGGQGLVYIMQGGYENLGIETEVKDNSLKTAPVVTNAGVGAAGIAADIKFGYCTEFFVSGKGFTAETEKNLGDFLNSLGDSIVLVRNDDLIKVHVHSNHPGQILEKALELGALENIKVENMRLQHTSLVNNAQNEKQEKEAEFGFVAVSAGDGLDKIFKDFGVDTIISGGQTMNPSIEDIATAVKEINAKNIFILPNNKNIIMAAKQAAEIVENKNVRVIESVTIPQGFSALLGFMEDSSFDENYEAMEESMSAVATGQVTMAVRDTTLNGVEIKKDSFIAIDEDEIVYSEANLKTSAVKLIDRLIEENEEACVVSLYYGAEVTKEEADEVLNYVTEKYEDLDVELTYGGQPVYYYIIGVE